MMHKSISSVLVIVLFAIIQGGCKKADIYFGNEYLDNGYTTIIKVDSFSTQVSTVKIDSFVTSGIGTLWAGGLNDPEFGKTVAQNYFELIPSSYESLNFENALFDSLTLILKLNKTHYGDSTKPFHVSVSKLIDRISPFESSPSSMYNTQSVEKESTTLGEADYMIRPSTTDSISIRLNDRFGKELLSKMQNPVDADLKTAEAFLAYLNGLSMHSSKENSMVLGIKDSVIMRLHYKTKSLYLQPGKFDFTISSGGLQFSNIRTDRSASALSGFGSNTKELPSTSLGNKAYSQYLTGMLAKIQFSKVREILKFPNFVKLAKVNLIIRPLKNSYITPFSLPSILNLSTTTQLNLIGVDISETAGSPLPLQNGNLTIDNLYGENTNYSFDITNYINLALADATDNKNGLLLVPNGNSSYSKQFDRLVIGDKDNPAGKLELQIFYITVQ